MEKKPHIGKAIAVLSATAVLLAASCFTGQTYGRYQNYSQWRSVYAPRQTGLRSDRLTAEGQTVLLNGWPVESQVSRMQGMTLSTADGTVTGTIACTVDCPEYLTVSMDRDVLTVGSTGVYAQLIMTPTQDALLLTELVAATVRVTFTPEGAETPALWADYQIDLLPAVDKTQPEVEPVAELTPEVLAVSNPKTFAWAEYLALQITAPTQADTLVLAMNGDAFPEGTRYIFNETAYLLGEDMQIEIAVEGEEKTELLLDFSLLDKPSAPIVLQAQTLHQQVLTAVKEVTVSATREALWMDTSAMDLVLTDNAELKIPICSDISETVWRLEMLTDTESGITYIQSGEQFYLVVSISEETDENGTQKFITISNASTLAPAGTYRLTLERLYEDQILGTEQVQFFLCY